MTARIFAFPPSGRKPAEQMEFVMPQGLTRKTELQKLLSAMNAASKFILKGNVETANSIMREVSKKLDEMQRERGGAA